MSYFESIRSQIEQEALKQKKLGQEKETFSKKREEEETRIREAKNRALDDSIVPKLTQELVSEIKPYRKEAYFHRGTDKDFSHQMTVYTELIDVDSHPEVTTYEYSCINIQGNVDGSVKIGDTLLSAKDARDEKKVSGALINGFKNPTKTILTD